MEHGHIVSTHLTDIRSAVSSTLARYTGAANRWDVDDLTQEVVLRLLDGKLDGYDASRPAGPFVARIARNLAIDVLRGRKATVAIGERTDEDPTAFEAADDSMRADERMVALDEYRALRAKVDALSVDERTELEASVDDDYDIEARAAALGLSVSGLRVRLCRIRKKIA